MYHVDGAGRTLALSRFRPLNSPPFNSVDQWLEWQTSLHHKAIDLGLDRVRQVADKLGLDQIASRVVTVAGTNGKGSTVAAYETWLHQSGYRVASYTSPHLLRYNERIKYALEPVADKALCEAFAQVENARGEIALTYFEYGTLAALYLMRQWRPDFAILEVGLGGRLDAVNIIDADLVHITPIGIDHQAWLGTDREQIGFEKAGVLRPRVQAVINDADPPQSVLAELDRLECRSLQYGVDYQIEVLDDAKCIWRCCEREISLRPILPGLHQYHNLAGVLAGLSCLVELSELEQQQIEAKFEGTRISGRFEELPGALKGKLIVDVGHNQDAAKAIAQNLQARRHPDSKIVLLLGMLEDKQAEQFVMELKSVVDIWWCLTLNCDRGLSAEQLKSKIDSVIEVERLFDDPVDALDHALSSLSNQDIMLATGSFVTVESLLRILSDSAELNT